MIGRKFYAKYGFVLIKETLHEPTGQQVLRLKLGAYSQEIIFQPTYVPKARVDHEQRNANNNAARLETFFPAAIEFRRVY